MDYDLVNDIEATPHLLEKIRDSKVYAQNLYAAMCNMRWQKADVYPILKDEYWSVSWRNSGGIVADLRGGNEDYMDWYCSGIRGGFNINDDIPDGYVGEGTVTDEIKSTYDPMVMKKIGTKSYWEKNVLSKLKD